MLSLAGLYDTAVLVSGDEDFVYAVNAVAYKGCRVEVAGFRSNTAPKLIDVADYFIDLGEIADKVRKETAHSHRYYENHTQEPQPASNPYANHNQIPAPDDEDIISHVRSLMNGEEEEGVNARRSEDFDESVPQLMSDSTLADEDERLSHGSDFIRVTDDQ
jgi:recombination DNA repair RAD52 pathway protein